MPGAHETEASPAPEIEAEVPTTAEDQISEPSSTPDVTADPSAADENTQPKSLLDVVQDAIKPPAEAPEEPSASDPAKPEEGPPAEETELSEDELAKLPFGKHPRFKGLIRQNNDLKGKAAELETQVTTLKGDADQYRRIAGFMQAQKIEPEDFGLLMKLGALMKNDPEAARKELLQTLWALDEVTGDRLPDDIRKDVEEGRITEDRGRELSRARASAARATARVEEVETARRQESETTRTEQSQAAIGTAVADWETRTKGADPDFAAKDELVADRVIAMNARLGQAKTPEEAVQRCEDAYAFVTQQLKSALPPKPEVRRSPESSPSSPVAPVPKSALEAVQLALRKGV